MFTKIECGECGGTYYPARDLTTGRDIFAMCDDCGHEMSASDFIMDEGESLVFGPTDALGYITEGVA